MGLQERQAEQHGELSAHLTDAAQVTAGLADTTQQLRRTLAGTKARGQWGERMADDVLRLAGFIEGISYVKQRALPGGTIPDVTFLLPGDLLLNMDVKFPVDNYVRALDATTAAERAAAEKAFLRDVRARVRELAGRGYVIPGITVDHVLLFIPNEAVYGFVHERDPDLADVALGQKVVLCSPFTLFAVLGVIRQAVDAVHLTRASDEILTTLADFRDQWERFSESLDAVGQEVRHRAPAVSTSWPARGAASSSVASTASTTCGPVVASTRQRSRPARGRSRSTAPADRRTKSGAVEVAAGP